MKRSEQVQTMDQDRWPTMGEGEPLLRRTLVVAGAMLASCVLFLGAVSLVVGLLLKPASGPTESLTDSERSTAPAPAKPAPRLPGKSI